jgi:primosomal protein N' (replication factor Y)
VRFASVALDISTRSLEGTFDYAIPEVIEDQVAVGTTVLVPFSHRSAVGYVMATSDEPPVDVAPSRLLAVAQVLAPAAFGSHSAAVARWIAHEYACPLADAVRLFLAPGQKVRVTRESPDAPWELVAEKAAPADARWVSLAPDAQGFVPARNASRQREVLEALSAGAMRLAELSATIPGASTAVSALAKRGVVTVETRRQIRGGEKTTLSSAQAPRPQRLTQGQLAAVAAIDEARSHAAGDVVLVDGVTGSGKTEVYLEAIERTLAAGKGALVLVPEISLTAQTVGRFRSRFGDDVAVLHSRLSTGERFDQWDLVRQGAVHVVVGARSALFAPLANVGLIIIDEEHESSYKQDSSPRYHAREVAARMAQ